MRGDNKSKSERTFALLTYTIPWTPSGLNNQKISLFGLFLKCKADGATIRIPPTLTNYAPNQTVNGTGIDQVPIGSVFDVQVLRDFCEKFGVPVKTEDVRFLNPKECFNEGGAFIGRASSVEEINLVQMMSVAFAPSAEVRKRSETFLASIPQDTVGVQLRIEKDWLSYAEAKQMRTMDPELEDVLLDFRSIFQKVTRSKEMAGRRHYMATCDESDLPVPATEIIAACKDEFGIEVFFKSQVMPDTEGMSRIAQSMIDFETCLGLDAYVGSSRSTFANMLALKKFAMTGEKATRHYIFNNPGEEIGLRRDMGFRAAAATVIQPLLVS
jgi:hypothetical protein